MTETESRNFENRLGDYSARNEDYVLRDGSLSVSFKEDIGELADRLYREWEDGLGRVHDAVTGDSVYTGMGGVAYLHHFLFTKTQKRSHLEKCASIVQRLKPTLKYKYPSFLCGDAGVLALGISAHVKLGEVDQAKSLYHDLVTKCSPCVLNLESGVPDEVLFGRAGFLYALLFIKKEASPQVEVDDELIRGTCEAILKSGERSKAEVNFQAPLYYEWHDKAYLGAAHGFSGIMYMLLSAKDYISPLDLDTKVRPTIDYLSRLRFSSGNFPSSLGNKTDRLVHWCHGAPGFVFMFCKAFEVFGDYKYRDAAYSAGEAVWERGLLRKGFGLCHGVAGNGYALLYIHQVLQDKSFLHRAAQYANFCHQRGKVTVNRPDRPMSMFEGLAGTIHFLYDMKDPMNAKFPAFAV